MGEFEEWLEKLELQTLTDELKDSICEKALKIYADGYQAAKSDMIEHIAYKM